MIQSADIVETEKWGVVIVVPDGDLVQDKRIVLQIGDGFFDIIQSNTIFGHVENIPEYIMDVIIDFHIISMVEMVMIENRKKVKCVHLVRLNDIRLADPDLLKWKKSSEKVWDQHKGANYKKHKL